MRMVEEAMGDDYRRGLRDAMACVVKAQERISDEYLVTPRTIFGKPTRRHDQLSGAAVALSTLAQEIIMMRMRDELAGIKERKTG